MRHPLVYSNARVILFFCQRQRKQRNGSNVSHCERYHSQDPKACCTRLSTLELTVEIAMQTPAGVVPTLEKFLPTSKLARVGKSGKCRIKPIFLIT